jgi:hypothetical protein
VYTLGIGGVQGEASSPDDTRRRMRGMVGHRRLRIAIASTAAVVILVVAWAAQSIWGVGFGQTPPSGATRLSIATDPPVWSPFGCPLALLLPIRITSTADSLILVSVETGEPESVVWPSGFAAWRENGRATLIARDGTVLGREGDVLEGLSGGTGPDDDAFHVCIVGGRP